MSIEQGNFNEVMGVNAEPAPVDEVKPAVVTQIQKKGLAVTDRGSLALQTLEDQLTFAKRLIDDRMISSTFQTPQQVVIGFQYAKAMDMNEILALRQMYVVNGRPCLYGGGPLSLCQRSSKWGAIREFFIDDNGVEISASNKNLRSKVFGAVTQVWRKNDPNVQEDFFTLDDLAAAGLTIDKYGKKKDVWTKWEKIMMRYKARTMALNSKFADCISGLPVAEYAEHFSPEMPDVREVKSEPADEINKLYGPKTEENPKQEDVK